MPAAWRGPPQSRGGPQGWLRDPLKPVQERCLEVQAAAPNTDSVNDRPHSRLSGTQLTNQSGGSDRLATESQEFQKRKAKE